MVMEALVYILTLLFGVSTVIIIKNKRYKVVPFICLDIILTFAGFAITSFVILFVRNEALEALLIMSVFGLFLFLLGVNKSSCLKKPVFMRVSAISISLLITN